MFSKTSVNERDDIFNRTVLNILSNFITYEIIVCNGIKKNRIKKFNSRKNMPQVKFIAITKVTLI